MAGSRPRIPTDIGTPIDAWRRAEQIPAVVVNDDREGENSSTILVSVGGISTEDQNLEPTSALDDGNVNDVELIVLEDGCEDDETHNQQDGVGNPGGSLTEDEDIAEKQRIEQERNQQRDNRLRAYMRGLRTRSSGMDRIDSNLNGMVDAVDKRLNQLVLFTPVDQRLFGVQALAGSVIRESVSGHDPDNANHPKHIIEAGNVLVSKRVDIAELDSELQDPVKIHRDIAEISDVFTEKIASGAGAHGEATGRAILRSIIEDTGELRQSVSEKVFRQLKDSLTPEQRGKFDLRSKKTLSDVLDNINDNDAWKLLHETFESIPKQKSRDELIKFFHSLTEDNFDEAQLEADYLRDNPSAFAGDGVLNDIMMQDFSTMVRVANLTKRKDYGVVQEGTGVGQIKTPIFKLPGEKDAMDKLLEKAGDNVVNIGRRATLMLLDANTDKTNGVDGAILVAIYAPQMPVHDNEFDGYMIDDAGHRVEIEEEDEATPFKAGEITWRTRQWHITNDGYADMLRRMQSLKDDPDTIFEPFRNPREAIVEIFPLQEALFTVRSIVAAAQLTVENVVTRLLSESASRSTNGETTNLAVLSEIINLAKEIKLPEDATSKGVDNLVANLRDHAIEVQNTVDAIFAKMRQYVASDLTELPGIGEDRLGIVETSAS